MTIRQRSSSVGILFIKIFLDFRKEMKLAKKRGYKYAQSKMEKIHRKRATQLYNLVVKLGGVMIKLCQYFSTRRDIFPEPYIEILSQLQDSVPPVDFDKIIEVVKSEYNGRGLPFEDIEKKPLASASLGQVHKARLLTGEDVILKILKPNVENEIDIDFSILFHVFKFMSNFKVFKSIPEFFELLDEFIRVTGDECNFIREAYIAKKFREGMRKVDYIKVPLIYDEFSTRRVIVMEFVEGDRITDSTKWEERNNDPIIISRRLIEIYFHQFLSMKLLHFDPHPGNILVTDNNNIVIIDFGMSGEITKEMRDGMIGIIRGFTEKNYQRVLKNFDKLGFLKKGVDPNMLLPIMEYFADWVDDEYVMKISGQMRESVVFGENLIIKRTITAKLFSDEFVLEDIIVNESFSDDEIALRYHCNFGYPLVNEGAKIINIPEQFSRITTPIHNKEEECIPFEFNNDFVTVGIKNNAIGTYLTYEIQMKSGLWPFWKLNLV